MGFEDSRQLPTRGIQCVRERNEDEPYLRPRSRQIKCYTYPKILCSEEQAGRVLSYLRSSRGTQFGFFPPNCLPFAIVRTRRRFGSARSVIHETPATLNIVQIAFSIVSLKLNSFVMLLRVLLGLRRTHFCGFLRAATTSQRTRQLVC